MFRTVSVNKDFVVDFLDFGSSYLRESVCCFSLFANVCIRYPKFKVWTLSLNHCACVCVCGWLVVQ